MANNLFEKLTLSKKPDKIVEIIALYNGDILKIEQQLKIKIEILNCNYAIIILEIEKITKLLEYNEIEYIEISKDLILELNKSDISACIPPVSSESRLGLTGDGVIVGIIDSGIDYTHNDFKKEDNTSRILYIYDQTVEGKPPNGFSVGVEYTQSDINNALKNADPFSVVPQTDFLGHGTAVAGIASGNGRESKGKYVGVAPNSDIIAVKIGETQKGTFAKTTQLMRAIKYVMEKAQFLNKPVAINISWGTNDGAHDGSSLFENYLNQMAESYKTSICVATGNEADFGHHYFGEIKTKETLDISFFTTGIVESFFISLYKDFSDDFSVELIVPSGKSSGEINLIDKTKSIQLGDIKVGCIYGQPTNYTTTQEIYFNISTMSESLPLGLWKIRIKASLIVDGKINIWLPNSVSLKDNTYFSTPSLDTTLTIPSTTNKVITVGGYDFRTSSIASFSGRGYTINNIFTKPDLVAPSVEIFAPKINGGYDSFTGTSFAAPFVTGCAALMLQWGIVEGNDQFLYGQRIKAFLRKGAKRENNIAYPNNIFGYGILCLKNSLDYLVEFGEQNIVATQSDGIIDENSLTLEEFLKLPTTIDFTSIDSPKFREYIKDKPFIKLGAKLLFGYIVVYTNKKYFEKIYEDLGSDNINFLASDLTLLDKEVNTASGITQIQQLPYLNLKGQGVLIGIIDTGIDYTKDAFKYEDNTSKIKYIWDQTINGVPPVEFKYGAEFSQEQINKALASNNPLEIVPTVDEVGHGTFLASVAAGRENNEYIGAAPEAELICVKVRELNEFYIRKYNLFQEGEIPQSVKDRNVYGTNDFILGMEFVLNKAAELNRPVVICIGMGTNFGNHDGGTLIERYISSQGEIKGRAFITAAGNESNAKHHTDGKFTKDGETITIGIRTGSNLTTFVCYIWYSVSDIITVSVKSPTGEIVPKLPIKISNRVTDLVFENARVQVTYFRGANSVAIVRVRTSTPGIWEITLYGEKIFIGNYNAWLKLTGNIDPEIEFLNPNPNKTIVVPATALRTITCGAYNSFDGSLYVASSWGPTNLPRLSPDFVAPGVNVKGVYPTGYGTMSGTSVAAAVTSGAAAILLQWGIVDGNESAMDTDRVKALLISGCKRDLNLSYPNFEWGFGKLNLLDTFKFLEAQ